MMVFMMMIIVIRNGSNLEDKDDVNSIFDEDGDDDY